MTHAQPAQRLRVRGLRCVAALVVGVGLLITGWSAKVTPWGMQAGLPIVPGMTVGAEYTWNPAAQTLRFEETIGAGDRSVTHSFSVRRGDETSWSSIAWYERHEHLLSAWDPVTGVTSPLSDEERRAIAPLVAARLAPGFRGAVTKASLERGVSDGSGTYILWRGLAAGIFVVIGSVVSVVSACLMGAPLGALLVRKARFASGHCCSCGYVMRNLSVCPECGWTPASDAGYDAS